MQDPTIISFQQRSQIDFYLEYFCLVWKCLKAIYFCENCVQSKSQFPDWYSKKRIYPGDNYDPSNADYFSKMKICLQTGLSVSCLSIVFIVREMLPTRQRPLLKNSWCQNSIMWEEQLADPPIAYIASVIVNFFYLK